MPRLTPLFPGDHVSLESGTGLVHTAPGHGLDDFVVCQPLKIDAFAPVNDYGKFTSEAGPGYRYLCHLLQVSYHC